jgi:hypothetical protein
MNFKKLMKTNSTFRRLVNEEAKRFAEIIKHYDSNNNSQILKEYSADKIWNSMSEEEQWDAIGATADDEGPDLADKWTGARWDELPADLQDSIDLGEYELADDDQFGRSMIRGIKKAISENPIAKEFVDKFLKASGRASIDTLTVKQAGELNAGMWKYVRSKETTQETPTHFSINPREVPSGAPSKNRDWRGGMWTGD